MANDTFSKDMDNSAQSAFSHLRKPLRLLAYLLLCTAILIIAAGRINWFAAWVYFGLYLTLMLIMVLVLRNYGATDLSDWSKSQTSGWDLVLSNLYTLSNPITLFIAGLDVGRLGLSPPMPIWVHLAMLVFMVIAFGLIAWAMKTNIFFLNTDITQVYPEQYVIANGPYKLIRHPGTFGMIILSLALPLSFGSLWGLIPGGFLVLTFIMRTTIEDRILQEDLEGYREYSRRTKYRLIPGVW
jgi:protein-S-isoprenylcysteine O-methyltransferase Ste14